MVKERKRSLTDMEEAARAATAEALRGYPPPSGQDRDNLTLGKQLTDEEGIFELYVPGERPQDAKVISRAVVDRVTGKVAVEVFLPPIVGSS